VIQLGRPQAEQANPSSPSAEPLKPQVRAFFWCAAIAIGMLQAWAHRNGLSPDGISYIEIAEAAGRNGWHALVNAYWSPFYPLLLSISFRIFRPGLNWEFTTVHFVNFALYLANLFCFEIFLKELLAARRRRSESGEEFRPVPDKILWVWGYLLFLWTCQYWLSPAMVTPDMCVAGLVYLATALLLRVYQGKGNWLLFAALGALLGVAYLAKAAMFPVSFVFLASGFLLYGLKRESYSKALTRCGPAFAAFLIVAAPLVIALSKEKNRATFGDSGKIAYAEYVNRATWLTHWQGEPPGTGIPAHPTRKIWSDPPMYEFAQPVPGSYPPWYDPSYWYEGIRPHFSLKGQLWVLFRAANLYLKLISRSGALYVVLIALFVWVRKAGKWELGAKELWLVWLPSLAALGMYALVLVEQRYVSGFALALLMWILSSVRISEKAEEAPRKRAVLATMLAMALAIAWPVTRDLNEVMANKPYEHWEVAVRLQGMGISPGTEVGYIGTGLDAYWAHLAGVRIIAEIPGKDQTRFLAADSVKKREILDKFAEVGAKAVVTKDAAVAKSMDGWREIGGTHYYVWREPRENPALGIRK
jgi:hypothetical protein